MNKDAFYITTTAPYVNSKPHIGFALEIVQADVVARIKRMQGFDVFFNFGTDEHGQKIYQKALIGNKNPQEYVDEYAKSFDDLKKLLNLSYDNLTRTTDTYHVLAAQQMWRRCMDNGFIEKGTYEAKYCVGCELEKQDSDLVDNKCPFHPNLDIESIKEENYFFKFSLFENKLLDLYNNLPNFVIPDHRLKEITQFVKSGLKDFSVSRLKEKMPWGIPVPDDDKHVMYVWFDALTFYISSLRWPDNNTKFEKYWGNVKNPNALQLAGKDNLRQQAAMWQAMLLAANLPPSRQIVIHGFITSGGQKMSKSLGNVVDPIEYVKKYGADALRYYLLAKVSPFEDSDFTKESFELVYQSDLANGLGNTIARIAKLCEKSQYGFSNTKLYLFDEVVDAISEFKYNDALTYLWHKLSIMDTDITRVQPWTLKNEKLNSALKRYVEDIRLIAYNLQAFLPHTSSVILKQFRGPKIVSDKVLFPRLR